MRGSPLWTPGRPSAGVNVGRRSRVKVQSRLTGNACLGRKIDLEPDLDLDSVRPDARLPIPIVLEATRLAEGNPSRIEALIDAMAMSCQRQARFAPIRSKSREA